METPSTEYEECRISTNHSFPRSFPANSSYNLRPETREIFDVIEDPLNWSHKRDIASPGFLEMFRNGLCCARVLWENRVVVSMLLAHSLSWWHQTGV